MVSEKPSRRRHDSERPTRYANLQNGGTTGEQQGGERRRSVGTRSSCRQQCALHSGTTTWRRLLILTILSFSSRLSLRPVRLRLAVRGAGRRTRSISQGRVNGIKLTLHGWVRFLRNYYPSLGGHRGPSRLPAAVPSPKAVAVITGVPSLRKSGWKAHRSGANVAPGWPAARQRPRPRSQIKPGVHRRGATTATTEAVPPGVRLPRGQRADSTASHSDGVRPKGISKVSPSCPNSICSSAA